MLFHLCHTYRYLIRITKSQNRITLRADVIPTMDLFISTERDVYANGIPRSDICNLTLEGKFSSILSSHSVVKICNHLFGNNLGWSIRKTDILKIYIHRGSRE